MVWRLVCLALIAALLVQPAWAGTSNSLMDVSPDCTRLLVANPDNGTVTLVDTTTHQVLNDVQADQFLEIREPERP